MIELSLYTEEHLKWALPVSGFLWWNSTPWRKEIPHTTQAGKRSYFAMASFAGLATQSIWRTRIRSNELCPGRQFGLENDKLRIG
jgi:hypothetical protein